MFQQSSKSARSPLNVFMFCDFQPREVAGVVFCALNNRSENFIMDPFEPPLGKHMTCLKLPTNLEKLPTKSSNLVGNDGCLTQPPSMRSVKVQCVFSLYSASKNIAFLRGMSNQRFYRQSDNYFDQQLPFANVVFFEVAMIFSGMVQYF